MLGVRPASFSLTHSPPLWFRLKFPYSQTWSLIACSPTIYVPTWWQTISSVAHEWIFVVDSDTMAKFLTKLAIHVNDMSENPKDIAKCKHFPRFPQIERIRLKLQNKTIVSTEPESNLRLLRVCLCYTNIYTNNIVWSISRKGRDISNQ